MGTVISARRKPLAACVASLFALTAPTATLAATVTSCLDNGDPGTLRSVIAAAAEGGTVDFTGLSCVDSKITLSGSSISILQNSLTIDGSGATPYQLTIDASALPRGLYDSRIFTHSGSGGTLTVNDLVLTGGYVYHHLIPAYGGCLLSAGNVALNSVTVTNCVTLHYYSYTPTGGAVSVSGNLTLDNSIVSYSSAKGNSSARGGGVFVNGDLTIKGNSSINHNSAKAGTGNALGGGAYVNGNVTLDTGALLYNSVSSTDGFAKGGGAYVVGNLNASHGSVVKYDAATSTSGAAKGGGVYTKGDLTLQVSVVGHNTANGSTSDGGGAFVLGNSSTSYTTVKYNRAYGNALGGGLMLKGATNTIASSTISNNTSDGALGGVAAFGQGAGVLFELKNSTISSNQAGTLVGGIYVDSASVKLWNSTIAFNTAGTSASGAHSPGAELSANSNAMGANLQSTLISNNSVGSYQLDLTTFPTTSSVTFNGGALAVPANNLVRATFVTNLPTDTKQGFCPHLGPLRDNGGLTFTHALMSHSVAIDAGNDSSLLALYDQRGSAAVNGTLNYTRFSGTAAIADIGAYEVQQNDIVFNTDFEDCPLLAF